jgi:hypothetical protein
VRHACLTLFILKKAQVLLANADLIFNIFSDSIFPSAKIIIEKEILNLFKLEGPQ